MMWAPHADLGTYGCWCSRLDMFALEAVDTATTSGVDIFWRPARPCSLSGFVALSHPRKRVLDLAALSVL